MKTLTDNRNKNILRGNQLTNVLALIAEIKELAR